MKITLLAIGKTDNRELQSLIDEYVKRLSRYISFSFEIIPDAKNTKNLSETQQKQVEGDEILKRLQNSDHLILLDENGKQYGSVAFSEFLQKQIIRSAQLS